MRNALKGEDMRTVKFRGKRVDNNEWVYGYYATIQGINTPNIYKIIDELFVIYAVIPETVGQYTGLKDKNGVEIYEGDLLEYNESIDGTNKIEVIWNPELAMFSLRSDFDDVEDGEINAFDDYDIRYWVVTGNIHEGEHNEQV